MSVIVVIVVALLAYVYIRSNRQARIKWLRKVDLPGHWVAQGNSESEDADASSEAEQVNITFGGDVQGGSYRSYGIGATTTGQWILQGHTLLLVDGASSDEITLDLHLFKPGQIGLEQNDGKRILLRKKADNVVALRPVKRS